MPDRFVYLAEMLGYHKIGISVDPAARLREINSPACPALVHSFPSREAFEVEGTLHLRFVRQHVRGEWFRLELADVAAIRPVARCDAVEDLPDDLRPGNELLAFVGSELRRIGDAVRQHRERQGLSRRDFGKSIGVPYDTLSQIESGRCLPLPETIDKIRVAVGEAEWLRIPFAPQVVRMASRTKILATRATTAT